MSAMLNVMPRRPPSCTCVRPSTPPHLAVQLNMLFILITRVWGDPFIDAQPIGCVAIRRRHRPPSAHLNARTCKKNAGEGGQAADLGPRCAHEDAQLCVVCILYH